MRALTLKLPWGPAIAYWGKDIENRSRPPWASLIGERIAIHSGKAPGLNSRAAQWNDIADSLTGLIDEGMLPPDHEGINRQWIVDRSSAVLATARIYGYIDDENNWRTADGEDPTREEVFSLWGIDDHCQWILRDVRTLAEPVPCKGAQGFWTLPDDVERAVAVQWIEKLDREAT